MSIDQIPQILLSGLAIGAVYAFVALGLSLVFAVSKSLNLAQAEFAVAGALIAHSAIGWGWGTVGAFAFAIAAVAALSLPVEWLTFHVPRHHDVLTRLLISFAGVLVLHGLFLLIWGKTSYSLQALPGPAVSWAGARMSSQGIWLVGTVLSLGIVLSLWLRRSVRGMSLRATADNPLGARLYGIAVQRLARFTFVGAAAIAAAGGILAAPLILVRYDAGLLLTVKGFIAAVIGGLGRTSGALVGGLALGILEAFGASVLPGQYKNVGIYLALFLLVTYLPRIYKPLAA